jgi:uncharacterized protein (DUF1330 family)
MAVTLCVLLWPVAGQEAGFAEYEDRALERVTAHGGRVLTRVRATEGVPREVQVLRFPAQEQLEAFMRDPARAALSALRDRVVERTEVLAVEVVGDLAQPPR